MRDVVMRGDVFAHAAFAATAPGYPSTLMGYFAQLRQFLLDSRHQVELARRYEQGRPGMRPPFDVQLAAGAAIVSGGIPLLCEANDADDIERWFRLADEFGIQPSIAGGLEAWRVRDELARRGVTVVLTLDWGKEVKDPRPKEEEKEKEAPEANEAVAAEGDAPPGEERAVESGEDDAWEYDEPFAVRLERRKKWERGRDCALRLHEGGVRFVFGTASAKPSELLERVRTLVEVGLPPEVALAALTRTAAGFLGMEQRLGLVTAGRDATFTLWRADPLLDKKATAAWVFVDGFPTEFKEEPKKAKEKGDGPAKGIDPSGTWQLEFVVVGEGIKSATLVLEMGDDGNLTGTLEVENPMGGARVEVEVEGRVTADELEVECTLAFGQVKIETILTATIEADALDGEGSFRGPWGDEPMKQSFRGRRGPE